MTRTATTMKLYGAAVEDEPLVAHGNIATAAGCIAAIDLAAWIINKTHGQEISKKVFASVQPVGQGLACIY